MNSSKFEKPIIFMGTPQFAVPVLSLLIEKKYNIIGVYSQPPRTAGRGNKLQKSAIHSYADLQGIHVFTPVTLKDQIDNLKKLKPELIIVAAYGLILPAEILSTPKLGCINVHASLLPRWRGASPIQSAIISGDKITGITLMKMSLGLDEGDIITQKSIHITKDMTAEMLSNELSHIGATMVEDFLESPIEYLAKAHQQDNKSAIYAKKLTKMDGKIQWNESAENIFNKIRGLNPWPCAWTYMDGLYVKITGAEIPDNIQNYSDFDTPGTILSKDFAIKCGKGVLKIKTLCPSGGKEMSGIDFLNGHKTLKIML